MSIRARAWRLQRRRPITVDDIDEQTAQGTSDVGTSFGVARVVNVVELREVDGQIESLTATCANQPRTAGGAGTQLCRTDPRDER